MSAATNEALVSRAIEAIWNQGDLDVADELFGPGYVHHDGLIADLVVGPEAIKISAACHRLAFPDLWVTIDDCNSLDDAVVVHWTAWRVQTRKAIGDAMSSNRTSLTGTTHSRISDGKIVESWTEWDRVGVLVELGLATME
jgi:predicted ester cyclase